MSDCKAYRSEIVGACDGGELGRGARAHAEVCRACGDELRGGESLRALVRGLGKVEAPPDFEFRLRARMNGSGAAGRRGPFRGFRLVYAFAPVAAAACFLVVSASLYLRQAARTSPDGAASVATSAPSQGAMPARSVAPPPMVEDLESSTSDARAAAVASGARKSQPRTLTHRPRAAARQLTEVAAKAEEEREGVQGNTITASFGSAPVIKGRSVTIALRVPSESLRMILRDERGAGRVTPMRSVSFGSQNLLARENALRQAAVADNEGVW